MHVVCGSWNYEGLRSCKGCIGSLTLVSGINILEALMYFVALNFFSEMLCLSVHAMEAASFSNWQELNNAILWDNLFPQMMLTRTNVLGVRKSKRVAKVLILKAAWTSGLGTGLGFKRPGFYSQLCHWSAAWPWASYFTFWCQLSFPSFVCLVYLGCKVIRTWAVLCLYKAQHNRAMISVGASRCYCNMKKIKINRNN